MKLAYEIEGDGPPVVFVHHGIADARVWDPQWRTFTAYRRVRFDLPGFGRTPLTEPRVCFAAEVAALLDELHVTDAALVGASLGGRIALELALARPDLVRGLVLVGAGLPGFDWSAEVEARWEAEDEAVRRGDLEAAADVNVRLWVDGPRRRPEDVDPGVRAAVREMQRQAFELQAPVWDEADEEALVPEVGERLGEIRVPTLVLAGDEDVDDVHRLAGRLTAEIPGARSATVPAAAHVPNLERPAEFDALVLPFLAGLFAAA